jgi:hypothetical protein
MILTDEGLKRRGKTIKKLKVEIAEHTNDSLKEATLEFRLPHNFDLNVEGLKAVWVFEKQQL